VLDWARTRTTPIIPVKAVLIDAAAMATPAPPPPPLDADTAAAAAAADAADAVAAGGGVACAGLCCLDLLLHGATPPPTPEAIATFDGTAYVAGGSASNTARSLAGLGVATAVVGLVGDDAHGREMAAQLTAAGVDASPLAVAAPPVATSLAVVPVFVGGGRGCYVDLGANTVFDGATVAAAAVRLAARRPPVAAFHLGYPHLLPRLRAGALAAALADVRAALPAALLSLDVNGVAAPEVDVPVLTAAALSGVGLLHANLDEALTITDAPAGATATPSTPAAAAAAGAGPGPHNASPPAPPPHPLLARPDRPTEATVTGRDLAALAAWFHARGVGMVAITLGSAGAYVAAHPDAAVAAAATGGRLAPDAGAGVFPAYAASGAVNATGAGDAFVAGALAATVAVPIGAGRLTAADVARSGLAAALARVDAARAAQAVPRRALLAELASAQTLPLPPGLGGAAAGGGGPAAAVDTVAGGDAVAAAVPWGGSAAAGGDAATLAAAAAAAASPTVEAAYAAARDAAVRAAHPALEGLTADGAVAAAAGGGGVATAIGASVGGALGGGVGHVVR